MVEIDRLARIDTEKIRKLLLNENVFMLPVSTEDNRGSGPAFTGLQFVSDDGTRLNARIFEGIPTEPHILFFPAEYDDEANLVRLADGLTKAGMTLISLDYRGLGFSEGLPSVAMLPGDGEIFFQAVKNWMEAGGRTGRLVIMGRSMGCAVALDIATSHQEDLLCLIMESAFDKTGDFMAAKGLAGPEISILNNSDPFANREKMAGFKKPVLFIHSSGDVVQSLSQVEWLVAESRSKATQFQIAPGGTREELAAGVEELYFKSIKDYINLRLGRRPPLKPRKSKRIKG